MCHHPALVSPLRLVAAWIGGAALLALAAARATEATPAGQLVPAWIFEKSITGSDGATHVRRFVISPIVKATSRGNGWTLNLDEKNPDHREIIGLLSFCAGLDMQPILDELGGIVAAMPGQDSLCIRTTLRTAPVANRRIPDLFDAIEEFRLEAGSFRRTIEHRTATSPFAASTLDYAGLHSFLWECRRALLEAEAERGTLLTKAPAPPGAGRSRLLPGLPSG